MTAPQAHVEMAAFVTTLLLDTHANVHLDILVRNIKQNSIGTIIRNKKVSFNISIYICLNLILTCKLLRSIIYDYLLTRINTITGIYRYIMLNNTFCLWSPSKCVRPSLITNNILSTGNLYKVLKNIFIFQACHAKRISTIAYQLHATVENV